MDTAFRSEKDLFKNSKNFREFLNSVITKKKIKNKKIDYDKASWPYSQADTIGYNRAIEEIINLLKD